MRRSALAFLALSLAVNGAERPPACRLDNTLPPRVREAAEAAWSKAIAGHDKQPKTIAFNPTEPTTAFPIYFVRDRLAGGDVCDAGTPGDGNGSRRVFDPQTVIGICQYNSSTESLTCSSDAIRKLLEFEKRNCNEHSPALVYLFAHEFGHRIADDRGAFSEGTVTIRLKADRKKNLAALRGLCESDPKQIEIEEEADRFAFEVASKVFAAPPFRAQGLPPIDSVIRTSEEIYKVAETLGAWSQFYYGRPSRDPFPKTKEICELIASSGREVVLPQYRGEHPQSWTRLAAINDRLSEYLGKKPGAAAKLDTATLEINQMLDSVMASGYTAFAEEFCNRVSQIENGIVDCNNPPDDPDDLTVELLLPDGQTEKAQVRLLNDPTKLAASPSPPCASDEAKAQAFLEQLDRISKAVEKAEEEAKEPETPSPPTDKSDPEDDETLEELVRRAEAFARAARQQKTGKPEPPLDPNAPLGSTLTREELNGVVLGWLSKHKPRKTPPPPLSALRTMEGETLDQFLRRAEAAARSIREYKTGKPEPPLDPNAEPGSTLTVEELTELSISMIDDMQLEAEKEIRVKPPAEQTALTALRPTLGETFDQFLRRAEVVARRLREEKTGKPEPPLDPNAAPGSTLTAEEMNALAEALASEKPAPPRSDAPLEFQPSGTYRDVPDDGEALILTMLAVTFEQDESEASAQGRQMNQAFAAFFEALDKRLHEDGGSWVHFEAGPAEVGYDKIMAGAFFAELKVRTIARSPAGFDPTLLPEFAPLRRWVRDQDVWRRPWSQARFPIAVEFHRETGVRKGKQGVITKALTLEKIFDLDAARQGKPDRPSSFLLDLTSFIHERLVKKFGGKFMLDRAPGDAPFVLLFSEHMDLPRDWISSGDLRTRRMTPDGELSVAIDSAYDDSDHDEPVATIYPP